MAKNKPLKIDKSFEELTEFFKGYINASVIDKPVDYLTKHTKYEYVLSAVIDYGDFKAKIIFSPTLHPLANFLDLKLIYPDSPYEFSVFDVFNLFDIQDFRQYYYEDITTKTELQQGLDELFEVIEKYHYDIKKAGEGDNLLRLTENFEADWNSVTDDDSEWKEDMKNDELFIDLVHPYFTHASDSKAEKIYGKLKKANEKGNLDTLYERRLLKYLDSGFELEEDYRHDSSKLSKDYSILKLKITLLLFAICAVICIAAVFIGERIAFGDFTVIRHYINLRGINFVPDEILGALASALVLGVVANALLCKKLISKFAPEDKKAYFTEKQENDIKDNQGVFSKYKPVRIIAGIVLLAVSVFVIFFSVNSRFAEKGDEVKYVGGEDLGISTINKSELIIYRVEGYYDGDENDEDTYEKYDSPSYLVTDSKGNYFEFNNAYEGSGYARFIQSLSDDYSKEITTVKAIENIKEIKR